MKIFRFGFGTQSGRVEDERAYKMGVHFQALEKLSALGNLAKNAAHGRNSLVATHLDGPSKQRRNDA